MGIIAQVVHDHEIRCSKASQVLNASCDMDDDDENVMWRDLPR